MKNINYIVVCVLFLFIGYLQVMVTAIADDRKAGERMELMIKDVKYAFRWCPPGTFTMGSPAGERGFDGVDERQHQVTFSRGFWMLEMEVTQAMWESVQGNNPSRFKQNNRPVERVSWDGCQEFITKLNEMKVAPAGFNFSLPTEAQWEYACRAGTTTAYHFGNTLKSEQANVLITPPGLEKTQTVGVYPPNAWGLYDMHGNVFEWCQDTFGEYPRGAVTDPVAPADKTKPYVIRGGSWNLWAEHCRSAHRHFMAGAGQDFPGGGVGFRLALVPVATTNDPPGEVRTLQTKAEGGDADAQFALGMRYFEGDGVPQNDTEATKWIRRAAAQGHTSAGNLLNAMTRGTTVVAVPVVVDRNQPVAPVISPPPASHTCGRCNGRGTLNMACSMCNGTGLSGPANLRSACPHCNGKGFPTCIDCRGTGRR